MHNKWFAKAGALCLLLSSLTGCLKPLIPETNTTVETKQTQTALPYKTTKPTADISEKEYVSAMWFSFYDFIEIAGNKTEDEFSASVDEVIQNLGELGINTIYVHAVAFTDAFYESEIYPKTNLFGPFDYDPLEIFVEKAHASDMYIEAWVNPLRSVLVEESDFLEGTILKQWIDQNDERIRQVNGRYYLNPAYPEVRGFVCSVIREILNNYQVDGIHFDDYFYPDGADDRFDSYIYGETILDTDISREDFRRDAINQLVKEVYNTVKSASPNLTFGISVAGNIDNDVNVYFADPSAWIEARMIDYLIPQVYWGYGHPTKPYEETFAEWISMTENSKVKMYTGLAAYKIGTEDPYAGESSDEWIDNTDMMSRQIETAFEYGAEGFAIFRYGSLYNADEEVAGNVEKEIINIKNMVNTLEALSE